MLLATLGILVLRPRPDRPLLKVLTVPRVYVMPVVFVALHGRLLRHRLAGLRHLGDAGLRHPRLLLRGMDYPMAPLVLGIVLGDLLDKNFRRGWSSPTVAPALPHPPDQPRLLAADPARHPHQHTGPRARSAGSSGAPRPAGARDRDPTPKKVAPDADVSTALDQPRHGARAVGHAPGGRGLPAARHHARSRPGATRSAKIGLDRGGAARRDNGLRVTGLCRGGMFPAADAEGRARPSTTTAARSTRRRPRRRLPGAGRRRVARGLEGHRRGARDGARTGSRRSCRTPAPPACRWRSSRCIRCTPPTDPA